MESKTDQRGFTQGVIFYFLKNAQKWNVVTNAVFSAQCKAAHLALRNDERVENPRIEAVSCVLNLEVEG